MAEATVLERQPEGHINLQISAARNLLRDVAYPIGLDSPEQSRKIEWSKDVTASLKAAQADKKPLVVVFEEDYCGWCKEFDKQLSRPDFAGAVGSEAHYLKVSPSKDKDARTLANLVNVEGYPSAAVLNVSGGRITPVSKVSGYLTAEKFVDTLKMAFRSIPHNNVLVG